MLENIDFSKSVDFLKGEIIVIDKPLTWTSFNVVNKVRNIICRKLQLKKMKVGHAGTLDPLATGVLVLASGKYTKLIEQIQAGEKVYDAVVCLGATTPSYDLETKIDQIFEYQHITLEMINEAVDKLRGVIMQSPPKYSALKIEGKHAYDLARKGKEVILEKREIILSDIIIQKIELPYIHLQISCSKGTYIRSVAHDIGLNLNNGAYLYSLRRIKVGDFSVENAFTLEEFEKKLISAEIISDTHH
ncbi:MAG: tRNA pseudouridine(55) synthase TruB [Bacteroidales bacterium]|jgi:tRNA pseudouridine55 synthase|nr:tRNA pseudouridine(55) synthase TruB [Bacteroidales bacterium]